LAHDVLQVADAAREAIDAGHLDALLALMGEHHDQSSGRVREMETSNTTQLHPCERYCSEMHEAKDQYHV
jgi:hypothetical protein